MIHLKTIIIVLTFSVNSLLAQNQWSAEFRPNIDFTIENFGETKLDTGFGFEVAVSYKFMSHLGAYVGWGYNTFQTKDDITNFNEIGYTFGFQFIQPIKEDSKFSYLIRAGGIYNHIQIENSNGDLVQDTGHGLGYEFGVGLDYRFLESWSLRPQVGYRALSRNIKVLNTVVNVNLNYLAFGLGISRTF